MAAKHEGSEARRRRPAAQSDPNPTTSEESPRKRRARAQPAAEGAAERTAELGASVEAAPASEVVAASPDESSGAAEAAGAIPEEPISAEPPQESRPRRERHRAPHGNALGRLIEAQFGVAGSPCRSYSDLERHSGISREALSRYVTARPDRRRSPTIDTLVAIADAMHLSVEAICRAAAASVKGVSLPPEAEQRAREEVLGTLVAALTAEQFSAVVELLRQLHPVRLDA